MNYKNYVIRALVINKVVIAIIGLFIINFHSYHNITILLYLPFIVLFLKYTIVDAKTFIESVRFKNDAIEISYSLYFKNYILRNKIDNCSIQILRDKRVFFERFLLLIKIGETEVKQFEVLNWKKEKMEKLLEEFNDKIKYD